MRNQVSVTRVICSQLHESDSSPKARPNASAIKRTASPVLAAFGAAVLVACGGGSGGDSGGSGPPPPATYTIGGSVSGLSGTGLVLQNNGVDDQAISGNGTFTFSSAIQTGTAYAVVVKTQPSSSTESQTCTVKNGSGTVAGGNVTNVAVDCVTTAINGISVPPDPGVPGLATVEGVDTDSNGIRDDMDRFIAKRYGANAVATKAARTSARARQRVLMVDTTSLTASRTVLQDSGDAGVCAGMDFRAAGMASGQELKEIYLRTFNTPERLAKQKSVAAAAGSFTRNASNVVCP